MKHSICLEFAACQAWSENTGERLHNGIVLPQEWPPQSVDVSDRRPMAVPYLDHPPAVIGIDVGRQLFVDDFLIAETTLKRTFHMPVKHPANPVLKPETPIELGLVEPLTRADYDPEIANAKKEKDILGDKMHIHYIGFQGNTAKAGTNNGMYDRSATGVAVLRRDGFASMDAGAQPGTLTTRPLRFHGSRLFVNADVPQGTLRAEVRNAEGRPIMPFTLANSIAFTGNRTLQAMRWKDADGAGDLSSLAGKTVSLHFEPVNGSLYSFWVSRNATGRSDGYLAAGGPRLSWPY